MALLVAIGAVAALAGTVAYAVARATDGGSGHGSMMNGASYTMMGAHGKRTAWNLSGSARVRDISGARSRAQRFAAQLGLETGEVMQFTNNYYILLTDKAGRPATEVLVDRATGTVTLEYGPAMMWNTRYGMMSGTGTTGMMGGSSGGMMGGSSGGMMGGSAGMMGASSTRMMGASSTGMMGRYGGSPSWTPGNVTGPVGAAEARSLANRWLAQQGAGAAEAKPDALPGYFTFHVLEGGKITGMLSVNAQTGAVWFHWWHGRFVAMEG